VLWHGIECIRFIVSECISQKSDDIGQRQMVDEGKTDNQTVGNGKIYSNSRPGSERSRPQTIQPTVAGTNATRKIR
jgi:hypothetical protein